MPSSHHLQESVRPLEAPAAWAPVMLEGAQVSGTLGAVGTREGSRGELDLESHLEGGLLKSGN